MSSNRPFHLLIWALVVSPITATSAPNTFNTALPVAQGEFIWRSQGMIRDRSDDGALKREVSVRALGNALGYGVHPNLALFATVPYFFQKSLDVTTPSGRVTRETEGFGDASVFARYTLFAEDFTGATFRVAPFIGVTAPTGDDNDRDRLGELPRPLQAGDGAWDGFLGVVATYQTLDYQLDGQFLRRENGRHDGYAAGDELQLDGSLQYRLWPASLTGVSGTPAFGYALLEFNLVHRERDELAGQITDSGGLQWLIAPGLQYVSRRWVVETSVQLPMIDDPHGDAITDDSVWRIGFRRNF
ncbi:MAG: transporter [Marinobacter sp.]|uniref:transporter n=1 Tax=Marinobacter sp. TaxID=50741 RepID=UPI00299ED43A|nr:transporter [Marinobacter sp.]MDX1755540.1 transporter [Marinobacter sp.]